MAKSVCFYRSMPATQLPVNASRLVSADILVRYRSSAVQQAAASAAVKDVHIDPPVTTNELLIDEPKMSKPLTSREKLKAAIRDYGSTVLVFHIASGCTFLGMWYLIVSRYM